LVLDIFGFIKPDVSWGDIAAIGGLIASPLIFYFGYAQTKKSEQIKIAREVMDRVDMKYQSLDNMGSKYLTTPKLETANKFKHAASVLFQEIQYFIHLLNMHEITDRGILAYSIPALQGCLYNWRSTLNSVKEQSFEGIPYDWTDELKDINVIEGDMKSWIKKYGFYTYRP